MFRLQRLRFHTTSYITKHFAQCQGEVRPKAEIIFLFIRDTSGAGASGGPE